MTATLADRLDALLPQTQCTRCGYPGCRPYAEALAAGTAGADQCPPGGDALAAELARLVGTPIRGVHPTHGVEGPPRVAVIDEAICIGCAKCLPACPVDAIVGARRMLHTVIRTECSGCELCLPPCPVDCIVMVDAGSDVLGVSEIHHRAAQYRGRYDAHLAREATRRARREQRLATRRLPEGAP